MKHIILDDSLYSNYFYPVGENLTDAMAYIDEVVNKLQPLIHGNKHLNLWVRGSSGAILGALLAKSLTNKCFIYYIKKDGEHAHHSNSFSRANSKYLNIIIDDFSYSCSTLNEIWKVAQNYTKVIDYVILSAVSEFWGLEDLKFIPNNLICNGSYYKAERKGYGIMSIDKIIKKDLDKRQGDSAILDEMNINKDVAAIVKERDESILDNKDLPEGILQYPLTPDECTQILGPPERTTIKKNTIGI